MTNVVFVGEFLWWVGGGGKPNLVISDELIKSWIWTKPTYMQVPMTYINTFYFIGTPLFFTQKNSPLPK